MNNRFQKSMAARIKAIIAEVVNPATQKIWAGMLKNRSPVDKYSLSTLSAISCNLSGAIPVTSSSALEVYCSLSSKHLNLCSESA